MIEAQIPNTVELTTPPLLDTKRRDVREQRLWGSLKNLLSHLFGNAELMVVGGEQAGSLFVALKGRGIIFHP